VKRSSGSGHQAPHVLQATNTSSSMFVTHHRHACMYPRVPDTRPLPDGYGHEYGILPAGMVVGRDELCPWVLSRADICSACPVPAPLPSLVGPDPQLPHRMAAVGPPLAPTHPPLALKGDSDRRCAPFSLPLSSACLPLGEACRHLLHISSLPFVCSTVGIHRRGRQDQSRHHCHCHLSVKNNGELKP
jgi:hypothetical protein